MAKPARIKARDWHKPQHNRYHPHQKTQLQHREHEHHDHNDDDHRSQQHHEQFYNLQPQPTNIMTQPPFQGDIREYWSTWRLDESRSHYYRARWRPYPLPPNYRTARNSSMSDGQGGWWHYEFRSVKEMEVATSYEQNMMAQWSRALVPYRQF